MTHKPALIAGIVLTVVTAGLIAAVARQPVRELRVCADPNNLPFSNERGEGFENRLAEMVARELGARVRYTWWAQRRGFVRNTLGANACDVIMGVPREYELVRTTRPYYRSTYVFVSRRERALRIRSFDDPALRSLRIGVHVIGDDAANAPPAHALSNRGIVTNLVGYSIYGNYADPNPPAKLVEAAASGEVDVAVVWGPFAGYFATQLTEPLDITPVTPALDSPALPFVYDISVGVRRRDKRLHAELEEILARKSAEIDAILDTYGVPRVEGKGGEQGGARPGLTPPR